MPFSAKQFELDSEFERYVLDAVAPGVPPFNGHHALDWRSGRFQQHAQVTPGTINVRVHVGGRPTPST
ncbi:hypothetical protein [Acrocarpospora sp. B8E8]|uniref:hypothetical protein n=1 Tax=Acrocarpospora sp. B8E8 TaxID=3153572 RepID=UPI00325FBD7E